MCLKSTSPESDADTLIAANQSSNAEYARIDATSSRSSPNILEELISALKSPPSTPSPGKMREIENNTIGENIIEQLITINDIGGVLKMENARSIGDIFDAKAKNQSLNDDENANDDSDIVTESPKHDLRGEMVEVDWISDRMTNLILKELESLVQFIRSIREKRIGFKHVTSVQPGYQRDTVASSTLDNNKRCILRVIAKLKELIEG